MTRLIKILFLSLIVFMFTSCKKEPKMHKIKYEITFIQTPDYGYTNWMELGVTPAYYGDYNYDPQNPSINYDIAKTGHWDYEYWELKDGDKVSFTLWTAPGYYYEMRIYIDGTEVSYKKLYSDGSGTTDIEAESGWNDSTTDTYIEFTYYE